MLENALIDDALKRRLHFKIDAGKNFTLIFLQQLIDHVRCPERQCRSYSRGDGMFCAEAFILRMRRQPNCGHTRARLHDGSRMDVIAATHRRVLRDHGQRECLGQCEIGCAFVEIDKACRADTFDIAAVRREIQIRLDDFALAIARLDPACGKYLLQLPADAATVDGVAFARELHG